MRYLLVLVLAAGCVRPPTASSSAQLYRPATGAAVSPPGLVTPDPPKRTRSYGGKIALLDLALFLSFIPVINWAADDSSESTGEVVALTYAGAYVLGGPLIHSGEGNHREVGRSVFRRLLYPAIGTAAGVAIGSMLDPDSGECHDLCHIESILGGILGGAMGMAAAAVHDWVVARIE
jgi:hypothetical protein